MRAALLLTIALLASACTGSAEEMAQIETPVEPQAELVVASGLDAIAEAQGSPHILWFWGAH